MEAKTSDRIASELFNTLLVKKLEYTHGSAKTAEFLKELRQAVHRKFGVNSQNEHFVNVMSSALTLTPKEWTIEVPTPLTVFGLSEKEAIKKHTQEKYELKMEKREDEWEKECKLLVHAKKTAYHFLRAHIGESSAQACSGKEAWDKNEDVNEAGHFNIITTVKEIVKTHHLERGGKTLKAKSELKEESWDSYRSTKEQGISLGEYTYKMKENLKYAIACGNIDPDDSSKVLHWEKGLKGDKYKAIRESWKRYPDTYPKTVEEALDTTLRWVGNVLVEDSNQYNAQGKSADSKKVFLTQGEKEFGKEDNSDAGIFVNANGELRMTNKLWSTTSEAGRKEFIKQRNKYRDEQKKDVRERKPRHKALLTKSNKKASGEFDEEDETDWQIDEPKVFMTRNHESESESEEEEYQRVNSRFNDSDRTVAMNDAERLTARGEPEPHHKKKIWPHLQNLDKTKAPRHPFPNRKSSTQGTHHLKFWKKTYIYAAYGGRDGSTIYDTWDLCNLAIAGVSGATCKKFKDQEEAWVSIIRWLTLKIIHANTRNLPSTVKNDYQRQIADAKAYHNAYRKSKDSTLIYDNKCKEYPLLESDYEWDSDAAGASRSENSIPSLNSSSDTDSDIEARSRPVKGRKQPIVNRSSSKAELGYPSNEGEDSEHELWIVDHEEPKPRHPVRTVQMPSARALLSYIAAAILAYIVLSMTVQEAHGRSTVLMTRNMRHKASRELRDPFGRFMVALDNEAGTHVCRDTEIASNIKSCPPNSVGGIDAAGAGLRYDTKCHMLGKQGLGRVPLAPGSAANIVAQAVAIDQGYKVQYNSVLDQYKLLRHDEETMTFTRPYRGNGAKWPHYTMDVRELGHNDKHQVLTTPKVKGNLPTVRGNQQLLSKRQQKDAKGAQQWLSKFNHPPVQQAKLLLRQSINPATTEAAIDLAIEIYGKDASHLKGTTTKQKVSSPSATIMRKHSVQDAQVDIMFIDKQAYVILLLEGVDYALVSPIPDREAETVRKALNHLIGICKSKGTTIARLRSDNEGGIKKGIAEELRNTGIDVDYTGAGEHCSRVERRIRYIKEHYRKIATSLPYTMHSDISMRAVMTSTRFSNIFTTVNTPGTSPRQLFLGRPIDLAKDQRAKFGSYIQVTVADTKNNSQERTEGCIFCGNSESVSGTFKAYHIKTGKMVSRTHLTEIPMPDILIEHLEELANEEGRVSDYELVPAEEPTEEQEQEPAEEPRHRVPIQDSNEDDTAEEPTQGPSPSRAATDYNKLDYPYWPPVTNSMADLGKEQILVAYEKDLTHEILRRSEWHDRDFCFTVSVKAALQRYGDDAREVITKEIQQFIDKKVWHAVLPSHLPKSERKRIIPSKMFLKEKFLPNTKFDKLKARLVAGGHRQDRALYEKCDTNAPTVHHSIVMSVIAIAAAEHRKIATIDIGGAYLLASRTTNLVKVHVKLDRQMTEILTGLDESYSPFVLEDGTCIVELDKAMYGCIESAKLWYNTISSLLESIGFVGNHVDRCVFNKTINGKQCTLVLYVDDILLTCEDQSAIDSTISLIQSEYSETRVTHGPVVPYLGMNVDMSVHGEARITMLQQVTDIVTTSGVEGTAPTPAATTLFETDPDLAIACKEEQDWFHQFVAKILYVAKRTKPECLITVAYLATRVGKVNEEDMGKLRRLIRYMRGTLDRGICLRPGPMGASVRNFVDAAYGVHPDGKSHTGTCVMIGEAGPVHVRSNKQSIVTKSSTEAELVGTSDSCNEAFYIRNFIIAQGTSTGPVTLYQDNLSTMALLENGKSSNIRTRHIQIRYFWTRERVDEGELEVVHLRTEEMGPANILTKPVQGAQFVLERQQLTNWE